MHRRGCDSAELCPQKHSGPDLLPVVISSSAVNAQEAKGRALLIYQPCARMVLVMQCFYLDI